MSDAAVSERACDYCGLPIGKPLFASSATIPEEAPQFCCTGCRFAAAITSESGEVGQTRWTLTQLGLAIFFTMSVMVFTMTLWTQDVYRSGGQDVGRTEAILYELFRYLCLIFATPVVILLGGPLADDAFGNLRRGRITTDALLVLGVAAAFVYSLVAVFRGAGHVYFEVVCMVLVAVTLGRWLEATGKLKTADALKSLQKLLPEQVRVVASGQADELVDLNSVQKGQQVRVLPGERIPLDGRIEENHASIDEQLVTGESLPVAKQAGDPVFAGTVNLDGVLVVRVTSPASQATIQRIVDVVAAAAASRGRDQRLADRLVAWFVPGVVVVALATFAAHFAASGYQNALMSALAVVLIACPCALGIATPLALWAALGRASRDQVLFRDGDALSRLANVSAVCFDKTGTLTTGRPKVEDLLFDAEAPRHLVLSAAASLAANSTHSLSKAIHEWGRHDRTPDSSATVDPHAASVKTSPGRGISGAAPGVDGSAFLGSLRFMTESGQVLESGMEEHVVRAREQGGPIVAVGWRGKVRGLFVFSEQLRDEALPAVQRLREMGLELSILTGDHAWRAATIQRELGVQTHCNLLPQDKQETIARTRARWGVVAMVGDGVNDAPALASADVGVAMGCGADVSRDAADVCLMGNDLRRLPAAIELAKKTRRAIQQNLFWAFAYNVVGIGLAVSGVLNPILAAVAMVGSSFFVVTNSLRLSRDPEGGEA